MEYKQQKKFCGDINHTQINWKSCFCLMSQKENIQLIIKQYFFIKIRTQNIKKVIIVQIPLIFI